MYLIDTNVWLERFLDQARSDEVGYFLDHILSERLSSPILLFIPSEWC